MVGSLCLLEVKILVGSWCLFEVKIVMGPKDESNRCIAPAFYNVQVDLSGHFGSYSNVNKRAKIKIWLVIFCCSTTSATGIKVMEDYSNESIILASIKLSL